ncbi:hypothetical protein BpHYR1_052725 [Brachionus plicatilis]|uniref:Uncharacterized protein n=1 Tax=Brachionus plicatilis TaxID=10195 RepID=A0A3M7SK39_BRAPC|nr:hypothetical protein BpHYR1_052725 [Brachionus plicatilis]
MTNSTKLTFKPICIFFSLVMSTRYNQPELELLALYKLILIKSLDLLKSMENNEKPLIRKSDFFLSFSQVHQFLPIEIFIKKF